MSRPTITVHRRVEWMDTDAAGIWHYTTAFRYLEHAEMELHRHLGIVEQTFGRMPRVRLEVDYLAPASFA
jgi:acyl-CoA thioester hydrolase